MNALSSIYNRYIKKNDKLFANFSYMTIVQLFLLVAPLITYPYLIKVLGRDIYGLIITAQVLTSYASLIIDFGTNGICAKHVSVNRFDKEKLSEIVSSVLCVRTFLCVICFLLYLLIVYVVPAYREHAPLFLFTYLFTLNEVLFPQYFFQGIEDMKYITFINIITKLVFISLVFFFVDNVEDYVLVPILYGIGYILGGIFSMRILLCKYGIRLFFPNYQMMRFYIKDASAIFATDLICTIKDKLNYFFIGYSVGMGEVVIYDLGFKLNAIMSKPTNIIASVIFPRLAQTRSIKIFKFVTLLTFILMLVVLVLVNVFLPEIVKIFINEEIDLFPIRLIILVPLILSVSYSICYNLFIAFGYNKYVLSSIVITTFAYIILMIGAYSLNVLNNIYTYIYIALISYIVELFYRLYKAHIISNREKNEEYE